MNEKIITLDQFLQDIETHLSNENAAPVFLSHDENTDKGASHVLINIDEYKRLAALDNREAKWSWELSDEDIKAIEMAEYGPEDTDEQAEG